MDPQIKKQVLRMIPYGLYVLTSTHQESVAAGTVNWLSQASFKPPLLMVALKTDSHLHEVIMESGTFAVNLLKSGQKDLAAAFFRPTTLENGQLNGYRFEHGSHTRAPLLLEAPAWLEVRVTDRVFRGDHTVVVGEVLDAGVREEPLPAPLLLQETGWSYGG